jgi:hypothetical protein
MSPSPMGSLESKGIVIPVTKRKGRGSVVSSASVSDEYMMMMSPQQQASSSESSSNAGMAVKPATAKPRENMDIVLQQDKNGGGNREYEMMSPVSVDPEKIKRLEEPAPLSAIEERLMGGRGTPGTPVHMRSDSSSSIGGTQYGGARPKQSSRSKRSSFCSDGDGGGRWSPSPGGVGGPDDNQNAEYAMMDYSYSRTAIPIPRGGGTSNPTSGWMSPASSGSLVSGTPNSSDARFPSELSRGAPYLTQADDDDEKAGAGTQLRPPLRPFIIGAGKTVSTSSNSSLSGRSRTSSLTSRFIDIPSSLSKNKLSPAQLGKTPPPSGQSPNIIARFDSWFRSRAGSVPSRPNLGGRRRHRTQSEGEKDSPDNQEATAVTQAAADAMDHDDDEVVGDAIDQR